MLHGQLNRGTLEGTITDAQGSAIPNASVTITSQTTNVLTNTKTNSTGYYQVVDLVPGMYKAHFEAPGFAVVDMIDIRVGGGQAVRLDASLKVGSTQEHIEVTADVPLIETAASNFSTTVEQRTIEDTPMQGRDLQQLVYLLPGVANVAGPPGSNFGFSSQFGTFPDPSYAQGSDVSVNGGQGGANAWYLDGNLNQSGITENIAVNPSPDAVSEFQAITNSISAEYGRTGGGVFNVVLKSGTNTLHGSGYEVLRNSATNARNPFTSVDASGNLIKDRVLHYNDFGGTVGGPVVIPKIYNGKNKTFFFASVDHTILHLSGQKVFSVPTALERQGNFSEDPNVSQYGLWNPYSTVGPTANGTFQRTAFGTPLVPNGCLNTVIEASSSPTCRFSSQIPTSMLDPTAMFFLKSYPMPNYNDPLSSCPMGANGYKICDNYLAPLGSSQNPWNSSIKLDHQAGDKHKFFGEWINTQGSYNIYSVPWTGATVPYTGYGGDIPFDFRDQVVGIGYTFLASPTFFNEFRASYSRQDFNTHPDSAGYPDSISDLTQVKAVLAPSKIYVGPYTPTPTFNVVMPGGGSSSTSVFGSPGWANQQVASEAYTILDNVTKIVGRHTIKTGFIYRLEHEGRHISDPSTLVFNGSIADDPSTGLGGGSGLAQFITGAVANSSTGITAQAYASFPYTAFYLQDDYRVTSNLTVNIGARYDISGFWNARNYPESNFCLTCPNSATGLEGKMIYEGDPGFPKGSAIAPANQGDIAPRVNFSWSPFGDRKTVIRGGYNIFYTNATNSYNNVGQGIIPGPNWQSFNNWTGSFYPNQCGELSGQCVAFPLSDTTTNKRSLTIPAIPSNGQPPAGNRDPSYGYPLQIYPPPSKDPRVQQWGLDIERELPGNMMLDIGYVGTHGTHLAGETFRNFNFVPTADRIKYKTELNSLAPISNYYSGAQAALLEKTWGSSSLPLSYFLEPYPFYGSIFSQTIFDGTSIYHGLNVKLQKRYSRGLTFLATYTFSKKIYNASTAQLASQLFDSVHLASGRSGLLGGRIGSAGSIYGGAYQDPDNRNEDRSIGYDDIPHMFNLVASYELPVGRGKAFLNRGGIVNTVAGGWRLSSNFNAQSGVPLQVSGPCNGLTCRPNLVGNPSKVPGGQSASDWINASAFQPVYGPDQSFWANPNQSDPRWWQFGTAGAYLPGLRSPGFWNLDSSLVKDFHITETKYVQFRWEVFNSLNHQNLGYPNTNYCLPPGPDGQTDSVHQAGCQFGRITNVQTDPRSMQFSLKFLF